MNAHATHGANCRCHNCDPNAPWLARVEPMRPRDAISRRETRRMVAVAQHPTPEPRTRR